MFASAIVLCTFLSAPLMYVTAWLFMISSDISSFLQLNDTLVDTGIQLSWLSIVLCVITAGFLLATRRFMRLPHTFTFLLSLAVLKMCVGVIWQSHLNAKEFIDTNSWLTGFVTYLGLGGAFDARFTAVMLAVTLCLIVADCPNRGRIGLVMAVIGYSVSVVASVLVAHYRRPSLITPTLAFRLGVPQTVASIVVLVVCSVCLAVALIYLVRHLMTSMSSQSSRSSSSVSNGNGMTRGGYAVLSQEEEEGGERNEGDVSLLRESRNEEERVIFRIPTANNGGISKRQRRKWPRTKSTSTTTIRGCCVTWCCCFICSSAQS